MKNLKNISTGKVYPNQGFETVGAIKHYFIGKDKSSSINEGGIKMTDEEPWVQFYIRLVSYDNACKIIEYMEKLGGMGNITTDGFNLEGSKDNWEKVITFIEEKEIRYELVKEHPTTVTNKIVDNLIKTGL